MNIKPVSELLQPDLGAPTLNALIPNENNYSVLLMQPHGDVVAGDTGVQNRDRGVAILKFGKFLDNAGETLADLVVTPEYSMPWGVIEEKIKSGAGPAEGKLWALGCESIKIGELEELRNKFEPFATVIFEQLPADPDRFVSPLAYIFVAPKSNGNGEVRTVILVQFKTHPMGDPGHFEINRMQRGTCIYQFGGTEQSLKLISLICADAFEFRDADALAVHDRALIIHVQMNQNPRHEWFVGCRERLLRYKCDSTEIICLNWAADINLWSGGQITHWNNIAGSAWYIKSTDFDNEDITLCNNHRRGLYYTWLEPRRTHALFFNFNPSIYLLTASKVAHIGVAGPISRRRGPQLTRLFSWDNAIDNWKEQVTIDDGFSDIVGQTGSAQDEIERIANDNPIDAERVLALCAGKIGNCQEWYKPNKLESYVIDSSEIVQRITFAQDKHQQAQQFRTAMLSRCGRLWDILKTANLLPKALNDLNGGCSFQWSQDFPHQNVISESGKHATAIYMGEESTLEQIEATKARVAEYLHRASSDPDQSHSARQRLHIWFRNVQGQIKLYDPYSYVKIDQAGDTSALDLGRE